MFRTMGKTVGYMVRATRQATSGAIPASPLSAYYSETGADQPIKRSRTEELFASGLQREHGPNRTEATAMIAILENKIQSIHRVIGREAAEAKGETQMWEQGRANTLYAKIKAYQKEIGTLEQYLAALDSDDSGKISVWLSALRRKATAQVNQQSLKHAITGCLQRATFLTAAEAEIFEMLLYSLLDDEIDHQLSAIAKIGELGKRQATLVLRELLKNEEQAVSAEVIEALTLLNDENLFSLCKSYLNDQHAGVRSACLRGLYQIGDGQAAALVMTALYDVNPEVRNSAATFLGFMEGPQTLTPLVLAACDKERGIRTSALISLANIGNESCILPLVNLLDDEEIEIRREVLATLENLTDEAIDVDVADGVDRSMQLEKLRNRWLTVKEATEQNEAKSGNHDQTPSS